MVWGGDMFRLTRATRILFVICIWAALWPPAATAGEDGSAPVLYTVGRKALNYFSFRNWDIKESWTGFSEQPQVENASEIADTLVDAFMAGVGDDEDEEGRGVDELHIVFSEFKSMMSQTAVAHRIAPLVVEYVEEDTGPHTLYSFEPDATTLFEGLYVKKAEE